MTRLDFSEKAPASEGGRYKGNLKTWESEDHRGTSKSNNLQ